MSSYNAAILTVNLVAYTLILNMISKVLLLVTHSVHTAGFVYSGRGSHVKVWVYLMKGSYDDQLTWPLKGHCEVKLLNQISNSKCYLGNGKY